MIQVADQPGNNRLVLLARAPTTDKLILVLVALIGNTSSLRMHGSDGCSKPEDSAWPG